jgi:hypothetical protein
LVTEQPKLIDFIHTMRIRGNAKAADYYYYIVPDIIQEKEGIPPEQLLMSPMDRVTFLIKKPADPEGWSTAWGKAYWR